MFGKDKVKGHNRLVKSKSGFKVTRIGDFLRKRDDKDNTTRNVVLGVGAISALGIGATLLLKKKGSIKFPGKLAEKKPLLTKRENPIKVIEETIGTPPKQPVKSGKDFIAQMDEEWEVGKKKVNSKEVESVITSETSFPTKSNFPQVEDPWALPTKSNKKSIEKVMQETNNIKALAPAKFKPETIPDFWDDAITNKTSNSISTVVQPNSKIVPLLTGKKIPASRGNLYGFDDRTARRVSKKAASDAARIDSMEKTYKSIEPENLAMRATAKINHYLIRPRKTSNLGAPPKPTSLEKVINNSNIKQAQKKVEDRLSRAERYQLQKKASNAKKN